MSSPCITCIIMTSTDGIISDKIKLTQSPLQYICLFLSFILYGDDVDDVNDVVDDDNDIDVDDNNVNDVVDDDNDND